MGIFDSIGNALGSIGDIAGPVLNVGGGLLQGLDQRRADKRLKNGLERAQREVLAENAEKDTEIRAILDRNFGAASGLSNYLMAQARQNEAAGRSVVDIIGAQERRTIDEQQGRADAAAIRTASRLGGANTVLNQILAANRRVSAESRRNLAESTASARANITQQAAAYNANAATTGAQARIAANTDTARFIESTKKTIGDTPIGVSAGIPRTGVVGVLGAAAQGLGSSRLFNRIDNQQQPAGSGSSL